MMLNKKFRIFLLLIMLSYTVSAQDKQLAKADKNFDNYAFVAARNMYLNMAESGYTSADLYKKLGDAYYFNAALEEASEWYEKLVIEYTEETGSEHVFRYVQSLKSSARYHEADSVMEKFSAAIATDRRTELFNDSKDYLDFIEIQSGKFEIETLAVNSEYSDYAPGYNHRGQLVFASSRLGNAITLIRNVHRWSEMPFSDVFFSDETLIKDSLHQPKKLKGRINTRFHESSVAFSKDSATVYFTRNNYTTGKRGSNAEGTTLLKLYRATLNGNKWENIEELPFNSDEYSVAHPALNPDETKLYFASDMPGSKGMSDLYMVTIHEDGTFGTPQNLGSNINTEGRETFPYIGNSGRLYFSGDGHPGLGGLDVFVAEPTGNGSFSIPYNVGKPLNSPKDDFSFIIDENTKTGYFASNRNGGMGKDDIYGFTQTGKLITGCNQYLKGVLTDAGINKALANTEVILLDADKKEIAKTMTNAEGEYSFDVACEASYTVKVNEKDYKPLEAIYTTGTDFEAQNQFPLQMHKEEKPETGIDLAKELGVTIYFDSGGAGIRPDAEEELDKIIKALREYPELKIDIRSHTDSRGSAGSNLKLSEQRVQSTITYIVETGGIDKSRVTGRGYGESQLLNECKDNVKCSDEKHQVNRRSEFIVVQ